MESKTKINAEEGRQELMITRDFDLSLELLFKAHVEPELVAQWMGTNVLKLDTRKHGSYQFETADPKGNKHRFNGVIHQFIPNEKITRTFEMEGTPFEAQLEFLEFQKLSEDTSRLNMHIVYRSTSQRDQMLKMGMRQGMNMAHNRLEEAAGKLK